MQLEIPSGAPWASLMLALLLSCGGGTGPASVADQLTEARTSDGRYVSWEERLIDGQGLGELRLRGAVALEIADLDKDGRPDIVSAYQESSHIRVAFGSDDPDTWFRLSLAEGAEAPGVMDLAVGDLNGDSYTDLVAATDGHLVYLQNPGGRTRNHTVRGWRWDRVIPRATKGSGLFTRVWFYDLNRDGRLEVVAVRAGHQPDSAEQESIISWLEPGTDELDADGWQEHILARVGASFAAGPADLDGDGDIDLLVIAGVEKHVRWFENLGGSPVTFQEHGSSVEGVEAGAQLGASRIAFHDLNGDGRLDAVLADTAISLAWLEQPSDPSQSWKLHAIGSITPDQVEGFALSDLTGDGQVDVVAGSESQNSGDEDGEGVSPTIPAGRITWFENPGSGRDSWKRHDISRRERGVFGSFSFHDLDEDGDLDLIGTRGNSGSLDGLFWLEKLHSSDPAKNFTPAREQDSRGLPLPGPP